MKFSTIFLVALFLVSVAYNFSIIKEDMNIYDEGLILAGADRVIHGVLPYRDFWSIYPPGQFYAVAFLFKLFGSSVLVERVYDILIKSFLSLSVYLVNRKLGLSGFLSTIGWAMSVMWIEYSGFPVYPVYAALLVIFVGLSEFVKYLETNKTCYIVCCAFYIALSGLFRHDLAGMVTLAILITMVVKTFWGEKCFWYHLLYFLGAVALISLLLFLPFIKSVGLSSIINHLFTIPAQVMPEYRWLPYPDFSFANIQFFVFPSVLFISLVFSLYLVLIVKTSDKLGYGMLVLSLTGIFFINQIRVRSDNIHLLPVAVGSICLFPILLCALMTFVGGKKNKGEEPASDRGVVLTPVARNVVIVILFGLTSLCLVAPVKNKIKGVNNAYFLLPKASPIARAGCAVVPESLRYVVPYIQSNIGEKEAIYVGVMDHDKFISNSVITYYLANRRYATRYHELHPGVTTTVDTQKEIVQELQNNAVRMVILGPDYWDEPNKTRVDLKLDILDNYIATNYYQDKRFGEYEIWVRKP